MQLELEREEKNALVKDLQEGIGKFVPKQVYFGTSSWKYPGWKKLIYQAPYKSEKSFEEHCLSEYAEVFSAAGIDHTFYAWPNTKTMEKYRDQTSATFKFGLKATEKSTIFKYPNLPRYGKEAGQLNSAYLDANVFLEHFLPGLEPIQDRIGVIMFEFSHFYPGMVESGSAFVKALEKFLTEIRKQTDLPLSVEIRNASWAKPEYFKMLSGCGVGHVFNSWTKMPSIGEQLEACKGISLPLMAARLLLEPGVKYETAVEAYSPYSSLQNPLPRVRKDAAKLVLEAIDRRVPAYVFVNNRLEGCAPKTIEEILKLLK